MDKDLDITKLEFDQLDLAACYTGNNSTNKSMTSVSRPKIINALLQFEDNIHKVVKQLNAYDGSSILVAESNWMKRNHFSKYMPNKTAPKKVQFGQVCTVDYGKTYKGEIGYVHPALCVGKKDDKYLIIPMTTGKTWRHECYHPIINPNMTKENRQSCATEGFEKDGVLLISDAKFVSGGRILALHEIIPNNVLVEIQEQLFYIAFPDFHKQLNKTTEKNTSLQNKIENMERQIENLKAKNEKLSKRIEDLKSKSKES